jgi:hypothetical protein
MLHGATAFEAAWRTPTEGGQRLHTTRFNDACLCAISHVSPRLMISPAMVQSMRVKSIFLNRFNVICPVQPRAQK